MTKRKSNQAVKMWAAIFTTMFTTWLLLFVLVTSNVFPYSRCASWEGEPLLSHCDAPYWEGWDALPIWIGVAAFIGAVVSFVGLMQAHSKQKGKKR